MDIYKIKESCLYFKHRLFFIPTPLLAVVLSAPKTCAKNLKFKITKFHYNEDRK